MSSELIYISIVAEAKKKVYLYSIRLGFRLLRLLRMLKVTNKAQKKSVLK